MKKLVILAMAVILTAGMASLALAGNGNGVVGSPHDLRATITQLQDTGYGKSEVCRICHSPHDHGFAAQNYLNGLLWNHDVTTATYVMYDRTWNPALHGDPEASPVGTAKLCLACHDGLTAVDSFDEYTGTVNITTYPGVAGPLARKVPAFGGATPDLRGTHPISIEYNPFIGGVNGDPGLKPVTAPMGGAGSINDVLDFTNGNTLGLVQCSSCHDVHDANGIAVADTPLLRLDLEASAICLGCHVK